MVADNHKFELHTVSTGNLLVELECCVAYYSVWWTNSSQK